MTKNVKLCDQLWGSENLGKKYILRNQNAVIHVDFTKNFGQQDPFKEELQPKPFFMNYYETTCICSIIT